MQSLRLCCALLICVWIGTARASTATTEVTEMWWNPQESGWGVNVAEQSDTVFLTFFVYDAAQNPIWYTSDAYRTDKSLFVWKGNLYATNGPWFGGPYSSANVRIRPAGTVTFAVASDDLNKATLTYTVDAITVSKPIERQTWSYENLSGSYFGGYSVQATNCNPSALNGLQENFGTLTVAQSGSSFSATMTAHPSCSFVGTYLQTGKLGRVTGTYSCADGTQGTFGIGGLTPTIEGFVARVAGVNQNCQWTGNFGGIARSVK
jgi:hypothetical protein